MYKNINLKLLNVIRVFSLKYLQTVWDFKTENIIGITPDNLVHKILSEQFRQIGLPPILSSSFFCRGPNNTQLIHRDSKHDGEIIKSAIIIPVYGTENSKFQWFEEKDMNLELITITTGNKKSSFYQIKDNLDHLYSPIFELEVLNPIIANVSIPHRAISSGNTPRVIISVKFVGNPNLLL